MSVQSLSFTPQGTAELLYFISPVKNTRTLVAQNIECLSKSLACPLCILDVCWLRPRRHRFIDISSYCGLFLYSSRKELIFKAQAMCSVPVLSVLYFGFWRDRSIDI